MKEDVVHTLCTYHVGENGKNFWANIMGWKCGVIGNTLSKHGENTKIKKFCAHIHHPPKMRKKDEPASSIHVQFSRGLHANSIPKTEIEFHFWFLSLVKFLFSFWSTTADQQTWPDKPLAELPSQAHWQRVGRSSTCTPLGLKPGWNLVKIHQYKFIKKTERLSS